MKKRAMPFQSFTPNLPNTRHPVPRSGKFMKSASAPTKSTSSQLLIDAVTPNLPSTRNSVPRSAKFP